MAAEKLLQLGRRGSVSLDQIAAILNSGMQLGKLVWHLVLRFHGCKKTGNES